MSRSERNRERQRSLVCQWAECRKTVTSITGRKNHEKIHSKSRQQETKCEWCNTAIAEKTLISGHQKFSTEAPKGMCPHCAETKSIANMARHRKSCRLRNKRQYTLMEEERAVQKDKRENEIKGDMIMCELCSQPSSRANISRHRRICEGKEANIEMGNQMADSR